jgi:para-aminobenzoate synthetase component 1
VHQLDLTADELIRGLLKLSETEHVAILDSCGVGHLGSHLLIAGRNGTRTPSSSAGSRTPSSALEDLIDPERPTIFTLSYDLGARLNGIPMLPSKEDDVYAVTFDSLIIHDYETAETRVFGDDADATLLLNDIRSAALTFEPRAPMDVLTATPNFTHENYLAAIGTIKELIRAGDTYQTNLTQQLTVEIGEARPQDIFWRLRRDHPAPFAAFISRGDSVVVSASPERFFRVASPEPPIDLREHPQSSAYVEPLLTCGLRTRRIETSPIKGTRRRGLTPEEDAELRHDLLTSSKDRAENTMIVDLLRNDLGRVCEYGSVRVDKLCELEEHPTLFHLVSTVSGQLREDANFGDVIRALFPCGSITGAPKISTMKIIDELESTPRGLSMGAIGYSIPEGFDGLEPVIDLSVAIRTMVFRGGVATFNVGGGITIDSDPEAEYEESLLKAKALLSALNATITT